MCLVYEDSKLVACIQKKKFYSDLSDGPYAKIGIDQNAKKTPEVGFEPMTANTEGVKCQRLNQSAINNTFTISYVLNYFPVRKRERQAFRAGQISYTVKFAKL